MKPVADDHAANRAPAPVHLRIRVLRPADLDAHSRTFGSRRAVDDPRPADVAVAIAAFDRALADDSLAETGRIAEQRQGALERSGWISDRRQVRRGLILGKQLFVLVRAS